LHNRFPPSCPSRQRFPNQNWRFCDRRASNFRRKIRPGEKHRRAGSTAAATTEAGGGETMEEGPGFPKPPSVQTVFLPPSLPPCRLMVEGPRSPPPLVTLVGPISAIRTKSWDDEGRDGGHQGDAQTGPAPELRSAPCRQLAPVYQAAAGLVCSPSSHPNLILFLPPRAGFRMAPTTTADCRATAERASSEVVP